MPNLEVLSLGRGQSSHLAFPPARPGLLVLRTDSLGDLVLFIPALNCLRRAYPDHELTLLVESHFAELVRDFASVDRVWSYDRHAYLTDDRYRAEFLRRLAAAGFASVLNPVYSRERLGDEMVAATGAAQRIGWDTRNSFMPRALQALGDRAYTRLIVPDLPEDTHELLRHRRFLEALGLAPGDLRPVLPRPAGRELEMARRWDRFQLAGRTVVAVVPGAGREIRRWPWHRYQALLAELAARDRDTVFLLIGTRAEREDLVGSTPPEGRVLDWRGEVALASLPALLARCQYVLGNDTGPLHLAVALDVPSLTLVGGGHYGRFQPWGDPARHRVLSRPVPCRGCDWECRYRRPQCLWGISRSAVAAAVVLPATAGLADHGPRDTIPQAPNRVLAG